MKQKREFMTIPNTYLTEALDIIAVAHESYPDSRDLAINHAELLAECGKDAQALDACEAFTLRFGVDEKILPLGLKLREQIGIYDRVAEAGKHSISLCMIVKNEQNNIARCLSSGREAVHEMIVVDTGSTDRTADIATVFGARVYNFTWNGNFSDARNRGIEQATGSWLLALDADEALSERDYPTIAETVRVSGDKPCAWSVLTRNYTERINSQGWSANDGAYPDKEAADGWHPSWKVRLFPNRPEIRFSGNVHEMVETSLRQSGFEIRKASFVVHHYGELAEGVKALDKQLRYFETGMKKLEQNQDDLAAIAELAVQAGELEQFEQAISLWDRILARVPDIVEALFNKGYCLIGLKRYDEAMVVSRRALELDPDHKEAAFNYGTCELYVGDPKRALDLISSVAEKNPDYPLLQALVAVLFFACDMAPEGEHKTAELRSRGYGIDERLSVLDMNGRTALANQLRLLIRSK